MQMINIIVEILQYTYMLIGVLACYFVIKKERFGWMIWFLSTFIAIPVLWYKGMYGFIVVFLFYGYLDWKGWKEWK